MLATRAKYSKKQQAGQPPHHAPFTRVAFCKPASPHLSAAPYGRGIETGLSTRGKGRETHPFSQPRAMRLIAKEIRQNPAHFDCARELIPDRSSAPSVKPQTATGSTQGVERRVEGYGAVPSLQFPLFKETLLPSSGRDTPEFTHTHPLSSVPPRIIHSLELLSPRSARCHSPGPTELARRCR